MSVTGQITIVECYAVSFLPFYQMQKRKIFLAQLSTTNCKKYFLYVSDKSYAGIELERYQIPKFILCFYCMFKNLFTE